MAILIATLALLAVAAIAAAIRVVASDGYHRAADRTR